MTAGLSSDPAEKARGLKSAYFIEACANHYLTDMFSSGHMRAARRAFHYDTYRVMARGKFGEPSSASED